MEFANEGRKSDQIFGRRSQERNTFLLPLVSQRQTDGKHYEFLLSVKLKLTLHHAFTIARRQTFSRGRDFGRAFRVFSVAYLTFKWKLSLSPGTKIREHRSAWKVARRCWTRRRYKHAHAEYLPLESSHSSDVDVSSASKRIRLSWAGKLRNPARIRDAELLQRFAQYLTRATAVMCEAIGTTVVIIVVKSSANFSFAVDQPGAYDSS